MRRLAKKQIIFILLLMGGSFLCGRAVFAYDNETTHPALTKATVNFYNFYFNNKLNQKQKQWLIEGSIKEDTPPRWINHFYDPVYNEGWTGEYGPEYVSENLTRKFSDVFLSTESAVKAPDWAKNQKLQAKYGLYQGNQTWQKALYEYVNNHNPEAAFRALGYLLHLLQDMSVPDHTRNDTHPGDSPYENYAKRFNRSNFNILNKLKSAKPYQFQSLENYFYNLAKYSNNYFFSKDTVNISKYNSPRIVKEKNGFAYGEIKDGSDVILSSVDYKKISKYQIAKEYKLKDAKAYYPIYKDYFNLLSKEAVLYGAGIIDLFFKEAEKARLNPSLLEKPPKAQPAVISVFGFYDKAKRFTVNTAKSAFYKTKKLVRKTSQKTLSMFNALADYLPASPAPAFVSGSPFKTSPTTDDFKDKLNDFSYFTINNTQNNPPKKISGDTSGDASPSKPNNSGTFKKTNGNQNTEPPEKSSPENNPQKQKEASNFKEKQSGKKTAQNPVPRENSDIKKQNSGNTSLPPGAGAAPAPNHQTDETDETNAKKKTDQSDKVNGSNQSDQVDPADQSNEDDESSRSDDSNQPRLEAPKINSHHWGQVLRPQNDQNATSSDFKIVLSGTSTPGYTVLTFVNSTGTSPYGTTTNQIGNWQETIILEEGENKVYARTENEAGNQSDFKELILFVDTQAPGKINDLSADFGSERGKIKLSWAAPEDNGSTGKASEYIIKYSTSSTISEENWQSAQNISGEPFPANPGNIEEVEVSGLDVDQKYFWAVKSKDSAGNISQPSNSAGSNPSALGDNVVINEIQTGNREFVELYNPTSRDINMAGWYFSYYPKNSNWHEPHRNKLFPNEALIKSGEYYLIGLSGYATSGPLLSADWDVYSSNQLSNADGTVALFPWNPEEKTPKEAEAGKIDALGWNLGDFDVDIYEGEVADFPPKRSSLSRKTPGWDTENNFNDFKRSYPTPKNSAGETISYISKDYQVTNKITWTKEHSPYLLDSSHSKHPTIKTGGLLNIKAGVTVKGMNSAYPAMVINGRLKTFGLLSEPVVFTSFSASSSPGSWSGIVFDNADAGSQLNHTRFKYGGADDIYYRPVLSHDFDEMARVINTTLTIKNCFFENSQNHGLTVDKSELNIFNSSIKDNRRTGLRTKGETGKINIEDSYFSNNQYGIETQTGAEFKVSGTVFENNQYPAYVSQGYPKIGPNNILENNRLNAVMIGHHQIFKRDFQFTDNLPYVFSGGLRESAKIASGTVTTIEPGTIIKFKNANLTNLEVAGELTAVGTTSSPIVFTSVKDDAFGGDTNNDQSTTTPQAGDWQEILFKNGSRGELDHIKIRYSSIEPIKTEPNADLILGENVSYEP